MTWDPDGIVVGEAFTDYVMKLRNRDKRRASDGGNVHFRQSMSTTQADDGGQLVSEHGPDAIRDEMGRRAFCVAAGATVAAAATGTAAGEEDIADEDLVPNFESEYTPAPKVIDQRVSIEEHSPEMDQLDYVDNDGEVHSLRDDYGAVLEPADPDTDDVPHNPVSFHPSFIDSDEFTQFPRGVTREDADGDEEDVSALDAEEWMGDLLIDDDGDALTVASDALTADTNQSATFDNFEITSGVARKVIQLVVDVDQLAADSRVEIEVVDVLDESVTAVIDPGADVADDDVIAADQGSGVVYQTEIGELTGGSDLDDLEEVRITIFDADASLTIHGLNLELDSEWSFGTRQVYDEEDEELTKESLVEPTGRTSIVSLTSLTNQFTDATLGDVEYDVELRASEAPLENWEVVVEDVERGSYPLRYHLVGGLQLPGGLYEVEVIEAGEIVDEVRHPSDVYRGVEFAHDQSEIPTYDDVDDVEWTDATAQFEDGDMEDEVTITSALSPGDTVGLYFDLTEGEEIVSAMSAVPGGGGGAAAMDSGGGIMSNLWAWGAAVATGVIIFAAGMRRRAASAASGVRGGS